MPKTKLALTTVVALIPLLSNASDQNLEISYEQANTDLFDEDNRPFKPEGTGINYSFDFADDWSMGLGTGNTRGEGRWFSHRGVVRSFYESADNQSKAYQLSLSWMPKRTTEDNSSTQYGVNLSAHQINYEESSITYLPYLEESIDNDTFVLSLAYQGLWDSGNGIDEDALDIASLLDANQNFWQLSWSVGLQSIDSSAKISERPNTDPPIQIDIDYTQESLSVFADISAHYIIYGESVSWSPFVSVGWDWEMDTKGQEFILLSRGEQSISSEQSGTRFNQQIRTPDTGSLEVGINFFWDTSSESENFNSWNLELSYSQSLETEIDYDVMKLSLSVDF